MRHQWDHRNADRHGPNPATQQKIRRANFLRQVQAQYAAAPAMLAADRDVLGEPFHTKTNQRQGALELWVQRIRPIVQLSKQNALDAITRTHRHITSYFRWKKPPPNPAIGPEPVTKPPSPV